VISRAHLRDLQDLPLHARLKFIARHPRGFFIGGRHRRLLRRHQGTASGRVIAVIIILGLQRHRHRRELGGRLVRHPREHLRELRTAFAGLRGKPFPVYAIPLKAGMSIGMVLISIELLLMLSILLFVPHDIAGKCFIGFAIGESLGASALRIAGGIFTKIADIGSDLMKIVFKIKEDDARNPGVIADCTGDNAGDSVGPSADGFETYGVTGVALISSSCSRCRAPSSRCSSWSGSSSCAS
jgi:hypothetical protein